MQKIRARHSRTCKFAGNKIKMQIESFFISGKPEKLFYCVSIWMVIVLTAKEFSKQWDNATTQVPAMKIASH